MSQPALWDYLADYGSLLRLASSTAHAELVEGTPRTVGAKYHASISWEGLVAYWDSWLAQADRPRTLRWESDSHGGTCSVSVSLEPIDEGTTRATLVLGYCASESEGPLEPFAWGLVSRYFDHCVKKLHKQGDFAEQ